MASIAHGRPGRYLFVFAGIVMLISWWVSYKNRRLRDASGDPWNGHTLEWAISSPHRSIILHSSVGTDAWTDMKRKLHISAATI